MYDQSEPDDPTRGGVSEAPVISPVLCALPLQENFGLCLKRRGYKRPRMISWDSEINDVSVLWSVG